MTDERNARPVSGEIMAAASVEAARPRYRPDMHADTVDAEFETLGERAEPFQPAATHAPAPVRPAPEPAHGMDMLRRHETPPPPFGSMRAGPAFWIAGIGLAAAAFWVSGGHALVRQAPFLAAEPAQALRISSVSSRVEGSGQRAMLHVEGEAANEGGGTLSLPQLEIRITDNEGADTRYNLGTSGRPLDAGQKIAFSSRLAVPRNGVRSVSVIFGEGK